jgi:broad specificity phosphatase PhoE
MKRLIALLFAVVLAHAALAADPKPVTTVILVRHGEKVTDPAVKDPELTAAGAARARELARVLSGVEVHAIYVTPFTRTRQTAAPLAAASGVKAIEIEAGKEYPAEMAKRIRAEHTGRTVVVVGHSNTTPDVIRALGVPNPPAIPDSEYDDLFIVTFAEGSAPRLVALRYGAVAR